MATSNLLSLGKNDIQNILLNTWQNHLWRAWSHLWGGVPDPHLKWTLFIKLSTEVVSRISLISKRFFFFNRNNYEASLLSLLACDTSAHRTETRQDIAQTILMLMFVFMMIRQWLISLQSPFTAGNSALFSSCCQTPPNSHISQWPWKSRHEKYLVLHQ